MLKKLKYKMNNQEKIEKLIKNVFQIEEKKKTQTSTSQKASKTGSILSDTDFEICLRDKLSIKLPITKYKDEKFEESKTFIIFSMELFEGFSKKLICSNHFFSEESYYLEHGEDIFYINSTDLSKLYYYNSKNGNKAIIHGFEEQQVTNDTTKFYFTEAEKNIIDIKNKEENEGLFFTEIKFNLISKETISFIGENNNIPEYFLNDYFVKGQLLSKGNNLFALSFGEDKEFKIGEGIIHYPMKNYYIKLTTIKGEFDGLFISQKDFKLKDFQCRILCSQFEIISENCKIIFEFKNGNSGENKIISQAINYQKNAKIIFQGEKFYHIIIIRSKELGELLMEKINEEFIRIKEFVNFAILCMDNNLVICNESIIPPKKKSKDVARQQNEAKIEAQILQLQDDVKKINEKLTSISSSIDKINKFMENIEEKVIFSKTNENSQDKK